MPPGGRLRVRLDQSPGRCRVALVRAGERRLLRVTGVFGHSLDALLPPGLAPGLWSLAVETGGRRLRARAAVWVVGPVSLPLRIVHTSDFHINIGGVGGNRRAPGRAAAIEKVVAAINRLGPDLVIDTGDLVSRYGTHKHDPLSARSGAWQARYAVAALRRLQAPFFLVPGNHDIAFSWMRRAWSRYFYRAAPGGAYDYSFDYGPCHLVSLDASRRYRRRSGRPVGRSGFNAARLAWLEKDLAAAGSCFTIIFFHYDYRQQLLPLLEKHRVDLVLYGHSRPLTYGGRLPERTINGNLPGKQAWQLVTVSRDGLTLTPGPELGDFITAT